MTSNPAPDVRPVGRSTATPLAPTLVFVFCNSIGTGTTMSGLPFLARSAHGFTSTQNYGLALILSIAYIFGALGLSSLARRIASRTPVLNLRSTLGVLMVLVAAACCLPWFAMRVLPAGNNGQWGLWIFSGLIGVLTGSVWPIAESYVTGGRVGADLRNATGAFNTVWAIAVVLALWLMAPVLERHPLAVLVAQGGVFLVSIVCLLWFRPEPGRSHGLDAEPHPPVYERLLSCLRILLPLSFVLISALNPMLPEIIASLAVPQILWTPVASVWPVVRIGTFFGLQRWHGWHGRWAAPVFGTAAMLAGFALGITSGDVGRMMGQGFGLGWLIAGLVCFGIGVGTVYSSAFYYAMAVGAAEVEAGGKHEALIGFGYAIGPTLGLSVGGAARAGWVGQSQMGSIVLLVVGVLSMAGVGLAVVRARAARPATAPSPWHG